MYPMPHLSKMVAIPYQNYNKTDINVQLLKKNNKKQNILLAPTSMTLTN